MNQLLKVTPNITTTPQPRSVNDLSAAQKQLLKKFLDKLSKKNEEAINKVKKACGT
jgi:hypothetical protein